MSDFVEVRWTSGSIDEARRVCRYLVNERLVACAQIIPWIESIYLWDNNLETTQETKIILKTTKSSVDEVKKIILENSSYEVPEITFFTIEGGNEEYLKWMDESVGSLN